ncbi:MAG TPA: ABC transporter permease, partial [Blastocatellia bacterium]|nr:ABC transporter permease [Blastocatellia bacterium]
MDRLKQDLRYGIRMLVKKPLFTAVVILSLALCIGANTAVFSIVNAVLLQPYPHINTDSWVYIWEKPQNEGLSQVSASIVNFRDWKAQNRSFSDMVLWQPYSYSLSGSGTGAPEIITAAVVTPDLFTALDLVPAAGRMLNDSDGKQGPQYVAVISYGLWKRRFGGDPNLVGKTINLNLVPHTVVGVAPQGFSFPAENKIDVWTLFPASAINSSTDRAYRGFRIAGKLKPGVTVKQAQADMDVI